MTRLWVATAPVQGDESRVAGTVEWREHLEAWQAYRLRYGNDQDAERIADRGGFGYEEITNLLGHEPKTWEPRSRPTPIAGRTPGRSRT